MNAEAIRAALAEIADEGDPSVKHLKLASLCSTLFRQHGIELVVVGGSAIEFYTEGAYVSGDIDFCILSAPTPVTLRQRQEIMGALGAVGGPRSWQVGGVFIDVLASFENLARTPLRTLAAPFGEVRIAPVEEIIVERILVATYPQDYPAARECAIKMLAAVLRGEVEVDWAEVKRLAQSSAYQNWTDVRALTNEQAQALDVRSPYDSDV